MRIFVGTIRKEMPEYKFQTLNTQEQFSMKKYEWNHF